MEPLLLKIENLKTYYYARNRIIPAVDGVSFTLNKGEILGIVGESGCGKSTVARSVIGLLDSAYTKIEDGKIVFLGQDLLKAGKEEMNRIRGRQISMIFQNPLSYLNPVFTVGNQIAEAILTHERIGRKQAEKRVLKLLEMVQIPSPEIRIADYPHRLSGGMQQRILIAIALACNPELIIADEPTTALDVTIEAQILQLMSDIQKKYGMGILLISHNMGVIAKMCDSVLVMYAGVVVEQGRTADIFFRPQHPYTKGLLASIPSIHTEKERLYSIPGNVPRLAYPMTGCRFFERCGFAQKKCMTAEPPLLLVEERHFVRCWLAESREY